MNRFVLENTFIKIYIYHFSINIFIKIRSQCYVLETMSLSKMTSFKNLEGVIFQSCSTISPAASSAARNLENSL